MDIFETYDGYQVRYDRSLEALDNYRGNWDDEDWLMYEDGPLASDDQKWCD